jgi:diguanylate cyclase (GGDEF)-like protein/PAS domain S-box-containing protein
MKNGQNSGDQMSRYMYIINNIKDIVWELNEDLVFTFVSPNSKDMTGYSAEELLGRRLPDFLVEESKNYLSGLVSRRSDNPAADTAGKIDLHDVQFICRDGTVKWVEVSASTVFREGRLTGYIGTTRDISEKKEYERRLNEYIQGLEVTNADLKRMATVDILTGAYNRRKFEDALKLIIRRSEQHDIPFSLIFFDIDHFKAVNDRFGHKKGDYILRRVSDLASKHIRATDRLFRWGGEEFIILLPGADLKNAVTAADKIRGIIAGNRFGIDMDITVSLGVCEYSAGENADRIVSRLDKALYRAKTQGGNMVVSS